MNEETREFIKQTYQEAIMAMDPEHLGITLKQAGIDTYDPEVILLLRELDEYYGIY